MIVRNSIAGLAAAIGLLAVGSAADAATMLWTFSGQSAADGPVDATALVTLSTKGLTVSLTDLLADPTSDGQELSGIEFIFSKTPTTTAISSDSGTLIDINAGTGKGKAKTGNTVSYPGGSISHWGTSISGGHVYLATVGTGAAGGKPEDLIIGPGVVTGSTATAYSDANASIIGKDPQIQGTGVFHLNIGGLSVGEYLSGVQLEFGTSGTDYHSASCTEPNAKSSNTACTQANNTITTAVPEPGTWALMLVGLGGLGAVLRAQRRQAALTAS